MTRVRAGHGTLAPKTEALNLGPFIIDVEGPALTAADRERLRHPLVAGVVLFGRNFESRRQLTRLCAQIRAVRKHRLLIAVDHEGGRVQRFRDGFSIIAPMRELGALWDRDVLMACDQATRIGQTIGRELLGVGVDLSFAPVLDLDHGAASVIGDRALHADPRVVAMLARCLMHGLLLAGLASCGKHFPGHGFALADSHQTLPVDDRETEQILASDAAPYAWLGPTLLAVMPAHVVYPKADPQPAVFSRFWLQTILRQRLGFDGAVISDDLCMQAAEQQGDIVSRAQAALAAGNDLLLVCHRPDFVETLLNRLQWQGSTGFDRRLARLFAR